MPVRVRLTRKFAQMINGVDLSRVQAGEDIELDAAEAQILVAEGWAIPVDAADDTPSTRKRPPKSLQF